MKTWYNFLKIMALTAQKGFFWRFKGKTKDVTDHVFGAAVTSSSCLHASYFLVVKTHWDLWAHQWGDSHSFPPVFFSLLCNRKFHLLSLVYSNLLNYFENRDFLLGVNCYNSQKTTISYGTTVSPGEKTLFLGCWLSSWMPIHYSLLSLSMCCCWGS